MICIIDYGLGNLQSVKKALEIYYPKIIISDDKSLISEAQALVLPGVGAFGDAVSELENRSLYQFLKEQIKNKRTLGICLGMQLMFEESEESPGVSGLGLLPGKVKKLTPSQSIRVPHTGWNRINPENEPYFSGFAYFNHTYYCEPASKDIILAWTLHGQRIPAIVSKGTILAVQFHPEKSKELGAQILDYWINLIKLEEKKQ